MALRITALEGIPEVSPGDDLATLIAAAARAQTLNITSSDVVVIAHKVVSKSEGRIRHLSDVEPLPEATELANTLGKDPRLVQTVLDESREILRAANGSLAAGLLYWPVQQQRAGADEVPTDTVT